MVHMYFPTVGKQISSSGSRRLSHIYSKLGIEFQLKKINAETLPYELFLTWCQHIDDLSEIINKGKRLDEFLEHEGIELDDLSLRGLYYAILKHPYILRDPICWNGKMLTAGIKQLDAERMLPRKARIASLQPN